MFLRRVTYWGFACLAGISFLSSVGVHTEALVSGGLLSRAHARTFVCVPVRMHTHTHTHDAHTHAHTYSFQVNVLTSASFAIGLASQQMLRDIAAGIMVMIWRPFKVEKSVSKRDAKVPGNLFLSCAGAMQ